MVLPQVLEYQTNLVATVVLSDPQGHDWGASKPFRDGESVSRGRGRGRENYILNHGNLFQVSLGIQFWWYHMQVTSDCNAMHFI